MPRPLLILALTLSMGVTVACEPDPPPAQLPALVDLRLGHHPGVDRVVVELDGTRAPEIDLQRAAGPVREAATGREVAVAGAAVLLLRLDGVTAHDATTWEPTYRGPTRLAGGGGTVTEVVLVDAEEGRVTVAIGVRRLGSRVLRRADDPTRVVIDLPS